MFKEDEYQRFRKALPYHMMTLCRQCNPQSVEDFRKYCFDHIDFEKIFKENQIYNKGLKTYILDKIIDRTYQGYVMEERAAEIIQDHGFIIDPISEDADRHGIDIKAHKGDIHLNVQVKPYSLLTVNDQYARYKRKQLYEDKGICLMIYTNGDFMKFGGKYLINPKSLFDEKGNTTLCFLF